MSFIGKNIRKIRAVKKMSQADFAKIFNLARPSVGAYEEGRAEPKIDTIILMAQHFGLSVDRLLTKEITINELYHIDRYAENLGKSQQPPPAGEKDRLKPKGMPMVPEERIHEYLTQRENKDFIAALPLVCLPEETNRMNRAFEVASNEMLYLNGGIGKGDLVNCIFVGKEPAKLKEGGIYLIICKETFFLRRLAGIGKTLDFRADNPDFAPVRLGIDEIAELWLTIGFYRSDLQRSKSAESKLHDLENIVKELERRISRLEMP